MFGAISDRNIHALARSAIGLYASQIPTTLLFCSFYTFLMSMVLLFYKIVPPDSYAVALTVLAGVLTWHITTTFSVFGRIILHSNAMSEFAIFAKEEEDTMLPVPLFENLLMKAKEVSNIRSVLQSKRLLILSPLSQNKGVPVSIQYRRNLKRAFEKGEKGADTLNTDTLNTDTLNTDTLDTSFSDPFLAGDDVTVINRLNETRRSERGILKKRRRHTIGDINDGLKIAGGGDFKMSQDELVEDWMTISTKNTTPTQGEGQTPRSVPR